MAEEQKTRRVGRKVLLSAVVLACCTWATTHFEGTKHMPYRDIGGVWTVCKGHTGPDVIPGQAWTDEQCEAQDKKDIQEAAAAVASCVTSELTEGQWAGYTDFALNVGGGAFCRSTMARRANVCAPVQEACAPILWYVFVGKRDCRIKSNNCSGIITRRRWQYETCMGEPTDVQVAG